MTQSQLNRAVADATGETVAEVRRRGFSLADPDEVAHDPERYVDWDAVDRDRYALMPC